MEYETQDSYAGSTSSWICTTLNHACVGIG